MKALWILGAASALTLGIVACGDDDDDGGDGGTGGTTTGGSATGGAATGGGDTGGSATGGAATGGSGTGGGLPSVTCDPTGDGVCENETDCEFVESGEARSVASACGQTCNTEPPAEKGPCAVACINMELGMSSECSACYAGLVGCTFDNCLGDCAADPSSSACVECQVENECLSDFETCSGLSFTGGGGAGGATN
jgi:hypothetical protein